MTNYDFSASLSPIDFELLSKDLLEADLRIRFENFKEGRDRGIDLRHSRQIGAPATIVQCKRYGPTQYSNLKSSLKNGELLKIRKLKPARYILSTSVSLSADQVDELVMLLSPFVKSPADIYGRDRLNAVLGSHPEIERSHLKLWIGSAGVIDGILNAGTHAVSREELERTVAAAKLYVKNPSFDEALDILKEHRVCIISGQPGIGKTTLARMLLIYFHERDFEVVKIESDVSEARRSFSHKKSKFIYYDDFLGQTASADKLNKNEDQKLLDFMKTVRDSKDLVFVLTTREYILNQARLSYEKLERERFDHKTCVIDLGVYSRKIRAQILYNHLYFSALPKNFIASLVSSRCYLNIVDHKNYNPRLVEFLTDIDWVGELQAREYPVFFLRNLNDPARIWDHAFRRQISEAGRNLLMVLTTLPPEVRLSDCMRAFTSLHVGAGGSDVAFRIALKELDGTFTSTRKIQGEILVAFSNPSIRDFTQNRLVCGERLDDVLSKMVFFEQAIWFARTLTDDTWKGRVDELKKRVGTILEALVRAYEEPGCHIIVQGNSTWQRIVEFNDAPIDRLVQIAETCKKLKISGYGNWLRSELGKVASDVATGEQAPDEAVAVLGRLNAVGLVQTRSGERLVCALKDRVVNKAHYLEDFEMVAEIVEACPGSFSHSEVDAIQTAFESFTEDFEPDSDDSSNSDSLREIASRFSNVGDVLRVDTGWREDSLREEAERMETENPTIWEPDDDSGHAVAESCSDGELDSMFRTLE